MARTFEQGDEPNYLALTASIVEDLDVDISNQAAAGRDDIPASAITELQCIFDKETGAVYPVHNIGLPVALAPFYRVGGRAGILMALALAGALLAANIFLFARSFCEGVAGPLIATASAGLTAPLFIYSHHLYPAVPLSLAAVYGCRLLQDERAMTPARQFLLATVAVVPPWLNYKNGLYTLALVGLFLWRLKTRRERLSPALFLPLAAALALVVWMNFALFGGFAVFGFESGRFIWPFAGLLGLLVDQTFGLFAIAPHYAVMFGAIWLFWKRWPRRTWEIKALVAAIMAPDVFYMYWHGNWSPPGRYMVEIIPFMCAAIAYAFENARAVRLKWAFAALTPFSLWVCLQFFRYPALNFTHIGAGSKLFAYTPWLKWLSFALPTLSEASPADLALGGAWLAGILLANAALIAGCKEAASPEKA